MPKEKTKFSAETHLKKDEQELFAHIQKRIREMKEFRERSHYGVKLDTLFNDADQAYIPHRLKKSKRKVIAEDEDKGWRGTVVTLGSDDWQSDITQGNPFVKISTALAILVDQNPSGVFTATKKSYESTSLLIEQLYQRSWEVARSKGQLKLFVHNLAKYGWAVGRTYPLRLERDSKILTEYDPEDPSKSKYETKRVVEYNDIMRENLDVRNTWLDDMARPNDQFSIRDWCWRKVYTMDKAEEEFGKYPFWDKFVTAGGVTTEVVGTKKDNDNEKTADDLIEIYFYENRLKDVFGVIANGIPVVIEPLPISDEDGVKKLSLWQAYWQLRHANSPYGVGIYEAIRYNDAFLDRIRNMTIDQLTMSIYKMFFYKATTSLTDTGDITIKPGVGKQVLDPKDINWMEVPGPGADAYKGLEMFKDDVDEASGITKQLSGEVTGKTAFEIALAKEAALKRLKMPLDNILDALNDEGYVTIYLIQLLYSIPEVYEISDPDLIEEYVKNVKGDPELFSREEGVDEFGEPQEKFTAKVFREFPLNLDEDEGGNLVETEKSKFFRVKPSGLKWEGVIHIKAQSILSSSKQIDKALGLEMYNILLPLLAQPPELYRKAAEDIVKMYDKTPQDVLPDVWKPQEETDGDQLIVDQPMPPEELEMSGQTPGQAQRFTAQPTTPQQQQGVGGGLISKIMSKIR